MRNFLLSFASSICIILLASCSPDTPDSTTNGSQYATSLSVSIASTRTLLGDKDKESNTSYPVFWSENNTTSD